jgi:hypothetical protein
MARRKKRRLTTPQKWVATLALMLLALGLANLARGALAWQYQRRLPNLSKTLPLSWGYLMGMGFFWGGAFVAGAAGLLRFRPWGRRWTLATTTLYQAHVWLNRLLFDASDYARQAWALDLALSLLLMSVVWRVLSWPKVRSIFQFQDDGVDR